MKGKLISCKGCNTQIVKEVKVCPNCGAQNIKPIWSKWWFWILMLTIFSCAISIRFISKVTDFTEHNTGIINTSDGQVNDTFVSEDAYLVGSDLEISDVKISYLSWEEYISDNMSVQPAEGYWFISCEFLFENLSASDYHVSASDFYCYADGVAMDNVSRRDNNLDSTISTGSTAQGTVTFEVPMDATVVEVEYVFEQSSTERVVFSVS